MTKSRKQQNDESTFRSDAKRKTIRIPPPRKMADVLGGLMARQGYARVLATSNLESVWRQAAGERLAGHSRPGVVKRGVLEVLVRSSAVLQDLTFAKAKIVKQLIEQCPSEKIRDVKFRVAAFE